MSSKDYANDVGMSTAQKVVPMPYVIALLAVIVVGGFFGFSSAFQAHSVKKTPPVASK